jgi:hypothetical protein
MTENSYRIDQPIKVLALKDIAAYQEHSVVSREIIRKLPAQ